jgi:hypothetical protein
MVTKAVQLHGPGVNAASASLTGPLVQLPVEHPADGLVT